LQAPLEIHDEVALQAAAATLHDAALVKGDWSFDPSRRLFILRPWVRERHAVQPRKSLLRFRRRIWVQRQWEMLVSDVDGFEILVSNEQEFGHLKRFEISDMQFDAKRGVLGIMTHYVLDIEVYVNRLHCVLEMTEKVESTTPYG